MSPQSGLPQNNRVGDLDSFAVPFVMRTLGLSLEEAERQLCKESGLKGSPEGPTIFGIFRQRPRKGTSRPTGAGCFRSSARGSGLAFTWPN